MANLDASHFLYGIVPFVCFLLSVLLPMFWPLASYKERTRTSKENEREEEDKGFAKFQQAVVPGCGSEGVIFHGKPRR